MTTHYMIWPERRKVDEDTIRMWYADAVANGEAEPGYEMIEDIKAELDDIGKTTFSDSRALPPELDPQDEPIDEGLAYQDRLDGWHGPHHG
jgi:hypothetical protein